MLLTILSSIHIRLFISKELQANRIVRHFDRVVQVASEALVLPRIVSVKPFLCWGSKMWEGGEEFQSKHICILAHINERINAIHTTLSVLL